MVIITITGGKSTEGPVGATGYVVGQICICKDRIKFGQAVSKSETGKYNHTSCHFRELDRQGEESETQQ